MRLPIGYALAYPDRLDDRHRGRRPHRGAGRAARRRVTALTFERPDPERFPCLRLAYEALARGGTAPAVLSAANEVAVAAFVAGTSGSGTSPFASKRPSDGSITPTSASTPFASPTAWPETRRMRSSFNGQPRLHGAHERAINRPLPGDAVRPRGAPRIRPFHRGPAQRRAGDRLRDGHGPDAAEVDLAAQRHPLPPQPAPDRRLLPDEGRGRPVHPGRAAARVPQDRRRLRARQLPGQDAAPAAGDRPRGPGRELHRRAGAAVRRRARVRDPGPEGVGDDLPAHAGDAGRQGRAAVGRHDRVDRRPAGAATAMRSSRRSIASTGKLLHLVYARNGRDSRST